jgi:hypothetical protein
MVKAAADPLCPKLCVSYDMLSDRQLMAASVHEIDIIKAGRVSHCM